MHSSHRTHPRASRRHAALAALAALPWVLSLACVIYRPIVSRPPTLGEELLSLDQARNDGLLTQAEYERRRDETIDAWKRIGETPVESKHGPAIPPPDAVDPAALGKGHAP